MVDERLTGRRQPHAPRAPSKERYSEPALEFLDALADCRGSDVLPVGRTSNVPLRGHGQEETERVEIELAQRPIIRIALSYDDNNEYRRRNVDHAADAVRREQRGSKNDEGISGACVREPLVVPWLRGLDMLNATRHPRPTGSTFADAQHGFDSPRGPARY